MIEVNKSAVTQMGIRKPVEEVYQAFINPEITTIFWFTGSTGKLELGKTISWKWAMYNLEIPVTLKKLEKNKLIIIEWGQGKQQSHVKWEFNAVQQDLTFLTITNYNFQGVGDELIAQIKDSTKGFTFVLAGVKAWLEHGVKLNLVDDAFPKELRNQ